MGQRVRLLRGESRAELLEPALSSARLSTQRFAKPIARMLSRSVLIAVERLPVGGFTWPMLPTNLFAPIVLLNTRVPERGRYELARLLLHEGAHLCGVVWPEWRNWVNTFARYGMFFVRWRDRRYPVFPHNRIYGVQVNSADRVAQAILEEAQAKGWR